MRDLNKWFTGLASVCLVSLVTIVFSMKTQVTEVVTKMAIFNEYISKNLDSNTDRIHRLEKDVNTLKSHDLVHTKYNDKIDQLLPAVQAIRIIMEKDK